MNRVLLSLAPILCLGCQSADPLAVFGPYKVPAPSTAQASPYYPPTGSTAQQPDKTTTTPRISVSVETPPPPTSPARLATEPTDRQPIRVVENSASSAGTTRTAAATTRSVSDSADANSAAVSTATAK